MFSFQQQNKISFIRKTEGIVIWIYLKIFALINNW